MNRKLVTVLLPVYNAEKFLREAIDSILNQTYHNIEFLIINDGSTDKSEDIILSYKDKRIRYVKNECNLKLIKTLNKGIDLAKGEYIARMDADDISLPSRLQKEVDFLETHGDIGMVSCFPYNMAMSGKVLCKSSFFSCTRPDACRFVSIFETPLLHPGSMFRSSVIKEYKYNDKPEFYHIEAYELWNRLMFEKNVHGAMIPEFLLKYRDNATSITHVYKNIEWERHLNVLKRSLSKYLGLQTTDEVLLCISSKKSNDIRIVNEAFNFLNASINAYFYKYKIVDRRDALEINNWAKQRKLAILLTSILSNKVSVKFQLILKLLCNFDLLLSSQNLIYIKNRITRLFNEHSL